MKTITNIVITGGPCAGKTSFMSHASNSLQELGYGVLVVSESATELMTAGCKPGDNVSLLKFQEIILETQMTRESLYRTIAKKMPHDHVIILYDRGLMDNRAYIDDRAWHDLLKRTNYSHVTLRDMRYDMVIHLQSAAVGAEMFYTTENNHARSESAEVARALDERTLNAWIGHPHVRVIDNKKGASFEDKMHRAFDCIVHTLRRPYPLEIERRYLISPRFDHSTIPTHSHSVAIEQAYAGDGLRLRKRTDDDMSMYTKTKKIRAATDFSCEEDESIISEEEYNTLMNARMVNTRTIRKQRIYFVYGGHSFELDIFADTTTREKLIILEVELLRENEEVRLPSWLPIIREITGEANLSNWSLAKMESM